MNVQHFRISLFCKLFCILFVLQHQVTALSNSTSLGNHSSLNTTLNNNSSSNGSIGDGRGQLRTDAGAILSLIALVSIGVLYCFFGILLFKPTLFITGFLLGDSMTLGLLTTSKLYQDTMSPSTLVMFYSVTAITVGIFAGCLFVCCWSLGIYVIGALGGYIVAHLILSLIATTVPIWFKFLLVLVCSLVGALLLHYFEKPMVISATAFAGGYAIVLGVDMVLNRGLAYDAAHEKSVPNHESVYEVLAALALGAGGLIFQATRGVEVFGMEERQERPSPDEKLGYVR